MKPTKPVRAALRDALLLTCCATFAAVTWELRHLVDGRLMSVVLVPACAVFWVRHARRKRRGIDTAKQDSEVSKAAEFMWVTAWVGGIVAFVVTPWPLIVRAALLVPPVLAPAVGALREIRSEAAQHQQHESATEVPPTTAAGP